MLVAPLRSSRSGNSHTRGRRCAGTCTHRRICIFGAHFYCKREVYSKVEFMCTCELERILVTS